MNKVIPCILFSIISTKIINSSSNQPTALIHGESICLSFISKTELYFYLQLFNYELYEENALTLSISSDSQATNPVIYSKFFSTDKEVSDLNELMPKSEGESEFKVIQKNKTNFILYFKRKSKSIEPIKDYLFVTIKAIKSPLSSQISTSLSLSNRLEVIDLVSIDDFEKRTIELKENIPRHIVMINSIGDNNYIVYITKSKQKIFTGRILNQDFAINSMHSEKQMFCLSYNIDTIKTIEFFGEKDSIEIYIEKTKNKIYCNENFRQSKSPFDIQIEEVNGIAYLIEEKGNGAYWFALEAKYGKHEYYYRNDFQVKSGNKGLTTLLPDKDEHRMKVGFERIGVEYYIIGIKALSPGFVTIHYLSLCKNEMVFNESIHEETLLLSQGNEYTIRLPNMNLIMTFISIYTDESNSVKINYNNTQYSLKAVNVINFQCNFNAPIYINTLLNSVITIKYMKSDSFTEITSIKYSINRFQYYYYRFSNLQTKSFSFRLGSKVNNMKYSIGIRKQGDTIYSVPRTTITAEKGIHFLTLANPNHHSTALLSLDEYYYFTMIINDEKLSTVDIEIKTVDIPDASYLPFKQLSTIRQGTLYSLRSNSPYSLTQLSLVLIGMVCKNNISQSLSFMHNKKQIIHSSLDNQFTVIEVNDYNMPLDFEYFTSNIKDSDATVLLSYFYSNNDYKQQLKNLYLHQHSLELKGTNIVHWTSPESIKAFMLYYYKKGTNTSSLNDECFLREEDGIIVKDSHQFQFNRSFSSGDYYVNVAAIGNEQIHYRFSYVSIMIKVSHFWFWFWIGFGSLLIAVIIIIAILVIHYYRKKMEKEISDEIGTIEPFIKDLNSDD